MKTTASRQILLLVLLCGLFTSPLRAQQTCEPPTVPLAISGENIFDEEQEMYLGDAVAEHLRRSVQVIDDDEVSNTCAELVND